MLAVVTGASSGIGRACARAFAERGLKVVCIGRRKDPLEEAVSELEQSGTSATALVADVGTEEGVATIEQEVGATAESVGTLVHAAGRESTLTFAGTDRREFGEVIATNLAGPFFLSQALLPRFAEGAAVVFVSSIAAITGRDRHAAYAASKAALTGLTKNLAAELAPSVRVNCVCPGPTRTPMFEQFMAEYAGEQESDQVRATLNAESMRVLIGRVAEPEELAASVAHLALDASAVTGTVLPIDGGYTAR